MQAVIHTPTNKLENSLSFYERLGFKSVPSEASVLYTDGKALVEINPDRFARAGLKIYKSSWETEVEKLKPVTAVTEVPGGFLLSDPSGVWIYLMFSEVAIDFKPAEHSFSVLGNFAGLSFETADFKRSSDIYEILGFNKTSGGIEQGWASYSNDGFTISLMPPLTCPHLFFNPSMTYFNGGKNLPVIEKIRSLDIPVAEEITHFNDEGIVDNIIIRDPGGYGFFIFND